MVNPPGDRNGGEVNAGETVRSIPTPFLTKTYQLVDDPAFDEIISWNEDGSAFVVRNPTEFARDLLPKYFKHNNFSSFVRQLNTYGFRKIVSDRWEFSNECFKKGEKSLLCDIHRRKVGAAVAVLGPVVPPVAAVAVAVAVVPEQILPRISVSGTDSGDDQVISSTCSPGVVLREGGAASGSGSGTGPGPSTSSGTNAELIGENQQLRKDNLQLNKELCNMKSMCNNIYSLMANYSNNCNNSSNNNGKSSETVDTPMSNRMPTALDLMPARECTPEAEEMNTGGGESHRRVVDKTNAKLFGVSIGMKRGREEDNNRSAEHGKAVEDEQHDRMIKVEPLDDDDDDNQESHV